jgi:chromate reductase, NAD(P)H dehydrogenase (quinone)
MKGRTMAIERNVAVLVGSLRKASFNRRAAHALSGQAPEALRLGIVEIGQLPHYNQDADDEGAPPATWLSFRKTIGAADAVLFVTPEHKRSVPSVLKNAIDVGSRPYGQSVWSGKPAAVMSVSPGAIGGFGANHHLRQSLVALDMPVRSSNPKPMSAKPERCSPTTAASRARPHGTCSGPSWCVSQPGSKPSFADGLIAA